MKNHPTLLSAFCLPPSAFRLLPSAFCLLLSAFCLLLSAFCLLPSASAQDLAVRAEKAIDAKDYATALTLLQQQVAADSKDYRALFNIGYVHTMRGEKPQAMDAYRRALEARPQLTQAGMNLAILLLEAGQGAEAARRLEAVVAARPKDARAQLLLADAVVMAGDAARAAEEYRKALLLDDKSADAHTALARLLAGAKQPAEAEIHLAKAIELRPEDAALHLQQAGLWEATGRTDEARRFYAEKAAKDPHDAAVRRRLGALLLEGKRFAEAAVEFEAAARVSAAPEDAWNLARAYTGAKKPEQALPLLEKIAAAEPRNYEARLRLGEMLSARRDFAAAQRHLEAAVTLSPQIPDAWVGLANVTYLQQNYPATLAVLDRVARVTQPTPWLHFLRAISLDKLDQVEPALESYQKFLAVSGGQYPDQEFQARQRSRVLNLRLEKSGKRRRN